MAEYIQSKIEVIHKVEGGKPTQKDDITNSSEQEIEIEQESRTRRVLDGVVTALKKGSVQRRLLTYGIQNAKFYVDDIYRNKIFKENLYGDTRAADKLRNEQANVTFALNSAQGIGTSFIMSKALKNPLLWQMEIFNQVGKIILNNLKQERALNQYNSKRDLEINIAQRRQERVNVGTYNRR